MTISLPSSLATVIRAGQDLEARIAKTQAALANARQRAQRAAIELQQAELERDRLAAERDLALGALAMDETPDTDPATLEKQLTIANKRLTTERAERDAAEGAERGLQARLTREVAERADLAEKITAAQGEARLMLEDQADAAFDDVMKTIIAKLGPLVAAEQAVGGYTIRRSLRAVILPGRDGQPVRHHQIQHAIDQATPGASWTEAASIIRRFARPIELDEAA